MSFLLDTNVLSELRKRTRCDPHVAAWMQARSARELFISVVAIGELWRGVEQVRTRDPATADGLERWVRSVEHSYRGRILPMTLPIARMWGRLSVAQPLPAEDALIAATALHHGLTVATRNAADFARSGAALFNPWEHPLP